MLPSVRRPHIRAGAALGKLPTHLWKASEAPSVGLIKLYYEGSVDKWDGARLSRLCDLLRITIHEAFALAGVFGNKRIENLCEIGKFMPLEIALHFDKLEKFLLNEMAKSEGNQPVLSDYERVTGEILARKGREGATCTSST